MPLLRKKEFQKSTIPELLRDDEEVFHCEITNEIFRDYDEFCQRIILVNSMVWSCAMTGKTNLTYAEALQSEKSAKKSLKDFPMELRIPVLYLASKTKRSAFGDMAEDVFCFIKDRFFVGEIVESSFVENNWKESHVLQVIAPSDEQIEAHGKTNGKSPEKSIFHPPAALFRYEVEQLDANDQDSSQVMIVEATHVRRKKGPYNREKNRLFLKQFVECNGQGIVIIKESIKRKYKLNSVRFDQIFDGPMPDFEIAKIKTKTFVNGKKIRQETLSKYLDKSNHSPAANGKSLLDEMKRKESEYKKKVEEMKQKKLEEKEKEKQKKKEENMKMSMYVKEWYKPRDDLELEDQKVLPQPTPVQTKIPDKHFGDLLMILEFVNSFSFLLSTNDFFAGGLTLDLLERALIEKEVAGPLTDIVQMLLTALFNVQEEETAENRKSETEVNTDDTNETMSLSDATRLATLALNWSKVYQGVPLSKLPLYPLTISEVLRLHLLSSGARLNEQATKWRYQQRGGYMSEDDPGLSLRLKQPHILKALAVHNINQLPIGDKITVLTCLVDQLLTYADVRDTIEERLEKSRQLKLELRSLLSSEKKFEIEFSSTRIKIKKENKGNEEQIKKELEKLVAETNKKKSDAEFRINEVINALSEYNVILGSDRSYQRYYKIESLPGFFVENDEQFPGVCLDRIVVQKPELVDAEKSDTLNYVKKLYEECNGSDKENDNGIKKHAKKVNGVRNSVKIDSDLSSVRSLNLCTANNQPCPVHSNENKPSWSFYHDKEDVHTLISSLNKRGLRESELRQNLELNQEHIESIASSTNASRLNPKVEKEVEIIVDKPINKKVQNKNRYGDPNLGFPTEIELSEVLNLSLIDNILEMEEKISVGGLGHLKVKEREKWRKNLNDRQFNELDKTLIKKEDAIDKLKKEEKENNSRPGTPDSTRYLRSVELNGHEELSTIASNEQQLAVKSLAIALVQVAQAVETKHLKRPLGHARLTKKEKDSRKVRYDIYDKWEQSLLCSSSYSQIFLHYCTLDNCIMWGRSVTKSRCAICHRLSDPDNMLLCDNCNNGYHLYCLKPKLTAVPVGDWFCLKCKPEEKVKTPRETRRARKIFTEESDDEQQKEPLRESRRTKKIFVEEPEVEEQEDEEEEEEEDEEEEEEVEEEEDEEEEETTKKEPEVSVLEVCEVCGSGGHVICCDFCPKVYHLGCTQPTLRRVPRGEWKCHNCRRQSEKGHSASSVSSDGSESGSGSSMSSGKAFGPRGGRRCASRARNKIHGFVRSLRRTSVDSGSSEETPQRRSARRTLDKTAEDDDMLLHNVPLQELLSDVMKHKDSWPFTRPVTKHEVPDYYEIISKPMDFGKIKYKLNMGEYKCDSEVMTDCALVFENCDTYNNSEAIVYKCGIRLLKYFEKKAKELGMNFPSGVMGDLSSDDDGPTQPKKARFAQS